ncbi:Rep family protein [Streptococcus parasanguinis]|uniref:Rep family protein n=1 Tax=Streptococcus parasanguinis TaxID=1318 RepID=UPI0039C4AF1B
MVEELIGVEENLEPAWAYETYPNTDRAKNYTLVVYPDDMPEDWLEIMQQDMYDMVISPYHDKDVNPDGTKKKPHYHILVWLYSRRILPKQDQCLSKYCKWGDRLDFLEWRHSGELPAQ